MIAHLFNITATHKDGKRIRPLLLHNEATREAADKAILRLQDAAPQFRLRMSMVGVDNVERPV